MKRLTLLRHAKSGWDDPALRDFDRPLNDRGHRAAKLMGANTQKLALTFDWIVASPALRVRETLNDFLPELEPAPPEPIWDKRIYLASSATLLDVARETPADVQHLLIVGHNPGLEELTLMLAEGQRDPVYAAVLEKYPTGAMATLRFEADDWSALSPGMATLARFGRPRDLDPELGPEH